MRKFVFAAVAVLLSLSATTPSMAFGRHYYGGGFGHRGFGGFGTGLVVGGGLGLLGGYAYRHNYGGYNPYGYGYPDYGYGYNGGYDYAHNCLDGRCVRSYC